MYELVFPDRVIDPNFTQKVSATGSTDRVFWKDVFGIKTNTSAQDIVDESDSEDDN